MSYFRVQQISLNAMGTFLVREKNTKVRQIQSLANIVLFPLNLIPIITSIIHHCPDFVRMADPLTLFFGILISMCKLFPLHFGSRNFQSLYERIVTLGGKLKLLEQEVIGKYVKFAEILTIANGFFLTSSIVVFLLLPLGNPIYLAIKGSEDIIWPNAFHWVYPFDLSDSRAYILAYVLTTYSYTQICIVGNAVDTIFLESCLVAAAHFKVLIQRIEDLQFKEDNYDSELGEIVKFHIEIHDLVSAIKTTYRPGIFSYFTLSSITICIVFFSLTLVSFVMAFYMN